MAQLIRRALCKYYRLPVCLPDAEGGFSLSIVESLMYGLSQACLLSLNTMATRNIRDSCLHQVYILENERLQ